MFKYVAWLGKLIAAGLILSFLSIWTTGYIVTSYVESILKQYELPLEVPPMAMSGVWGKLWGSQLEPQVDMEAPTDKTTVDQEQSGTNGTAQSENVDEPDAMEAFGEIEEAPITEIGSEENSHTSSESGAEDPPTTETGSGEGSRAAGESEVDPGREVQEGSAGVDGTEIAVSTGELESTKETMSEEDKTQLFQLLMTKLSQESLQEISEYVENGLTEVELISVEQIMAQHLNEEEYQKMMEILKKY
ncbi:hypothetical protein I6N90_16285 [Paenibacillus sp. GSMTC-2017]|uniref:hypothetical protein n=1 Tax=Paenibacillus sp. GSMTC-2017 TaxID=2794350 RepID=UPI0018D91B3C|nr:hypothetical protein [Paenibacillus sp. GSMTC-2017]MBH5319359.1 hypothetical protein [Paenibacillus sp. GSMTC-2017]